jgi:hypothetical protein
LVDAIGGGIKMIKPIFTSGQLLPSRAFNWASGAALSGVDVSRAGVSTFLGSNGLIQSASADTQRIDYSTGSAALLIEESRTNFLLNSVFDGAVAGTPGTPPTSWTFPLSGGTVGVEASLFSGASALAITTTSSRHFISQTVSASANTDYFLTIRLEVVSGSVEFVNLFNAVGLPSGSSVTYFLNGLIYSGSSGVPIGSHVAGILVSVGATAGNIIFRAGVGIGGNRTGSVKIDTPQLEAGALHTSYIPTETTAVTRNADVATITGANFTDFWRAGKGSALVRARPSTVAGIRPLIQFDDSTADNIISLRGNSANPELYVRTGGVDQAQIDAGTIAANTSYRLAGAWAENSCAASLNSGTPVLDGVATIPTVTQARLGSDGTNYLNGHIEAIEYYDERIPNSALQVVSSAAGYQSIIGSVFRDAIIS